MMALVRRLAGATLRLLRVPGRSFRPLVLGLLAVVAGWAVGISSQPSPVSVLDVHEADGAAVRGGVLDIVATVDSTCSACVTDVRRWLWRQDPLDPGGVEWVYLPYVPFRPPVAIGRDRVRLLIPVPTYVEQGDWHYLSQADDRWGGWSWWYRWLKRSRQSPDILVHIVDPTVAAPAEVVAPPGAIVVIPEKVTP